MTDPGSFAAVSAALYAAHQVADHWVQTQHQADHKGVRGWIGRRACAAHVFTYTVTALVALLAVAWRTGLALHPVPVLLGLTVSAVSHYIADRRAPLRRLAWAMQSTTGKYTFYRLGAPRLGYNDNPTLGTGAYALDQSWHIGWLLIAALIIA